MYCRAQKTATLTPIQHTVLGTLWGHRGSSSGNKATKKQYQATIDAQGIVPRLPRDCRKLLKDA